MKKGILNKELTIEYREFSFVLSKDTLVDIIISEDDYMVIVGEGEFIHNDNIKKTKIHIKTSKKNVNLNAR